MRIVILMFLLVLPMLAVVTSPFWFWRIRYIRSLRNARSLDEHSFHLPTTDVKLGELRHFEHDEVGDKTVVVHHLVVFAEDTQDKLLMDWLRTTIVTMAIVIFVALLSSVDKSSARGAAVDTTSNASVQSVEQRPGPGAQSPRIATATDKSFTWNETWAALVTVTNHALVLYGVPVGMLTFGLHQCFVILLLRDQARKYRSVLERQTVAKSTAATVSF